MSQSTVNLDKYKQPIIKPFEKQTIFAIGFTGSSKSTTVEKAAEELLDAGQTGFDAYGGEFHENAFWPVTMGCCLDDKFYCTNCKETFVEDEQYRHNGHKVTPPYPCNCGLDKNGKKLGYETDEGRYPMTLLVPEDFILTDKYGNESDLPLYFFNDNRFSFWEYKRYMEQKGLSGSLIEYNYKNPPQRPQGSPKVPWIRVVKLPKARNSPPNVKKGMWDYEENQQIQDIFLRELKFSRDEGMKRVVAFNIGFWPREFTRMKTLQLLIYSLKEAKERIFLPPQIFDRPKSEWTNKEKTHDRIFMLFRELGEVVNAQLKSDESGFSSFIKKALQWYIRKGRQLGCSMIGDMQRTEDVMPGIRTHSDWFFIKNSPLSMLGDTWKWLTNTEMNGYIDTKRQELLELTNYNYDKVNAQFPRIQDLSKSYGYGVSKDDVVRLINFSMPKHHHWDPDHGDHWSLITGIYFKFIATKDEDAVPEGEAKTKVAENTIEQVSIILTMLKDDTLTKKAIKEYSLEMGTGSKWNWENFVFPIYQSFVAKGIITTEKIRPTYIALKNYYNKSLHNKQAS